MVKTATSKAKDNLGTRDCLPQVSEFYGAHTASSSGKWTRRTTQATWSVNVPNHREVQLTQDWKPSLRGRCPGGSPSRLPSS